MAKIRVHSQKDPPKKEDQLAWQLARLALSAAPAAEAAAEAVICRVIDNAACAAGALKRRASITARDQAIAHPRERGATVFGLPKASRFSAEWAAFANAAMVRELDFHDTFLALDYAHPADNIPPILAVAESQGLSGAAALDAILAAYEVHISLVKGICLHKHKVDHIAHLCPAQTAGLGALLAHRSGASPAIKPPPLTTDMLYQAIQQAVHLAFTTRQSRKGRISSWKAFAPAFSAKTAIEAMDRCLRGERSPSPIYEGEDSVLAAFLGSEECEVPLPDPSQPRRLILESYPKAWPAEYQAQAFIDLAFDMRGSIKSLPQIEKIVLKASHHTHKVIGTGSGDPEKFDPCAGRETLDHSLMYIFSAALEDGDFHHERSYAPSRAARPETVALWQKIETMEDPLWTERYHHPDPSQKAFGGAAEIYMKGDKKPSLKGQIQRPHAHPFGKKPFQREDYIKKFHALGKDLISEEERERFLKAACSLPHLKPGELSCLSFKADVPDSALSRGLF